MSDYYTPVLSTLRQIRGLSPFFALDVGRPASDADGGGWRSGDDLADGAVLSGALRAIGERYRTGEARVSASLFFLGYTARLLSPTVAAHAVGGVAPDIRPANVWWHYGPDGMRVRIGEPVAGVSISASLEPVVAAIRDVVPVARGLLWGNAASSIAGALRTVSLSGTASAEQCVALGERLLDEPPLRGSGDFIPFPGEVAFRRRSCCLYYRLDGGGTCGDCPLPQQ
ncbi:(2Fe-2S)-binding protein [Actinosynnema sp. NPDC047251]|uniref:Ferric iron reductase n=1 Tax=Saccharothrix espanaensis (strain ATCC 51144 / DSM 44229 / JCM 9112 / NBRC 15066 / NRRL 15764) TaxID=1179773 RepID=K0JWN5_SACES|nr:(2Fe-2S)-binding protein [Saccharothrix espanaensis]CCH30461.1 Ferric iron reductase [Saccharothrix espanaensis DSM 44229]